MKYLLLIGAFLASSAYAETFKLPEGMTYRARGAGYDCGTFTTSYKPAPELIKEREITFVQAAADKSIRKFLIEATFPGATGELCTYGAFLDRDKENGVLNLTESLIVTEGAEEDCADGIQFLDERLTSVKYEASKRGYRFIAFQLFYDEANDVCENGNVRIVFDRR